MTPASSPPRRRNLVATRAALLDAATEVFARHGLAGATLDEIAETAGFTRGAVHHHFVSKEDLFLAVIRRRDEELLAGYGPDVLDPIPPDPSAGAARWRELHQDDECDVALRLELRSNALRSPALREQLLAVDRSAVAATAERLAELGAAGNTRWRAPVDSVAELLHAASHAASEYAAITGEDAEVVMRSWLDIIWAGAVDRSSESR
jgi:AcrR family transcriptional regulator